MPRCYEPAHIAGISKTAYVLATPRRLDWRHDPTANQHGRRPAGSGSAGPASSACCVVIAAIAGRPRPPVCRRPRPRRRVAPSTAAIGGPSRRPSERRGALGEADGAVPDGTTVFDDGVPGVAKLDPALLARPAPSGDRCRGRRRDVLRRQWLAFPEYQEQLLQQAVSEYGSEAEAARWVATPDTSAHVSGDAVDIGHADATAWLSEHGAAYGLCQIYGNEPWHYELRPEAVDRGCPPMYADPTHDPRMQR